mmetsp:Transcript_68522/g.152928  ORF Transcript_68522/g.152928 Transcript_68522/m.152928 type:complete len:206 (+) Transcript_68522:555-1172(+)
MHLLDAVVRLGQPLGHTTLPHFTSEIQVLAETSTFRQLRTVVLSLCLRWGVDFHYVSVLRCAPIACAPTPACETRESCYSCCVLARVRAVPPPLPGSGLPAPPPPRPPAGNSTKEDLYTHLRLCTASTPRARYIISHKHLVALGYLSRDTGMGVTCVRRRRRLVDADGHEASARPRALARGRERVEGARSDVKAPVSHDWCCGDV